ncbi:MAG: ribulose-phosphate 3-epimerase [Bacillota bacterium]
MIEDDMATHLSQSTVRIGASLACARLEELGEEIRRLDELNIDLYHWDIMDGHFVPTLPLGFEIIRCTRRVTRTPFEVHLMVRDAERFIDMAVDAGADRIIVHVEEEPHIHRLLGKIKNAGCSPGIALNPSTGLDSVEWIMSEIEIVMIMTVNPGWSGQPFLQGMLPKIAAARRRLTGIAHPVDLVVDGGVEMSILEAVVKAGANVIVTGAKGIFGDPRGYRCHLEGMREVMRRAQRTI